MIVFIAHYVTIQYCKCIHAFAPVGFDIKHISLGLSGMEFKKRFPSSFLAGGELQVCGTIKVDQSG
jgi:hypothetical protein